MKVLTQVVNLVAVVGVRVCDSFVTADSLATASKLVFSFLQLFRKLLRSALPLAMLSFVTFQALCYMSTCWT